MKNLRYCWLKSIVITTWGVDHMHTSSSIRYNISQSKTVILSVGMMSSRSITLDMLHWKCRCGRKYHRLFSIPLIIGRAEFREFSWLWSLLMHLLFCDKYERRYFIFSWLLRFFILVIIWWAYLILVLISLNYLTFSTFPLFFILLLIRVTFHLPLPLFNLLFKPNGASVIIIFFSIIDEDDHFLLTLLTWILLIFLPILFLYLLIANFYVLIEVVH